MEQSRNVTKKKVDGQIDNASSQVPVVPAEVHISRQIEGLSDALIRIGIELEKHSLILKQIRDGQRCQDPK